MKQFKINVHSIVDVITNSSSEIFVSTHDRSIDNLKEMTNTILKTSGSDKTFDDLFTARIEIIDKKWYINDFHEDFAEEIGMDAEEVKTKLENDELQSEFKEFLDDRECWTNQSIIVTSKDDKNLTIDFLKTFQSIFNTEEQYC